MTEREKLIKKKTIKYFIQQKIVELVLVSLILGGIIFIPYLIGFLGNRFFTSIYDTVGLVGFWTMGIGTLFGIIFGIFFIWGVFYLIIYDSIYKGLKKYLTKFLKWNWKKARNRAEEYYEVSR